MAQVKFIATDLVKYKALSTKDPNTLYFIGNGVNQIFKGDQCFSGGVYEMVEAFPATDAAKQNVLYVHKTTGEVRFYDGTAFQTVVLPKATTISDASTAAELATAKSVADYVKTTIKNLDTGALADRVTAVEGKADANETAIGVINGEGEGSIKKAAADAKQAAIDAAATDATSKANAAQAAAEKTAETKANAAQAAAEKTAADALAAYAKTNSTALDGKADKATTLAGYGIADAYTKDEANTAIATAVANAHHLKREIVSVLPEVSEANEDTIYMVPDAGSTDAAGSNKSVYTEYMLVNGAFERIGTSDVDLSNYFTKDQVTGAIATAKGEAATDAQTKADAAKDAAIAAAATDATTKADAAKAAAITEAGKKADKALEDAKAYSDGLAKNYATAAQGAKADSALQAADVVDGTVNGAISVKGAPVKVHGLGTAAYAATDDFATAAQGTKADSAVQAADVISGTANGTISVKGTDVAVKGLGSAAYQNSGAFESAGAAAGALSSAKTYADTKKTEAIEAAAADATTKANNALTAAKKYSDSLIEWGTL
jgi:hypothetical protein